MLSTINEISVDKIRFSSHDTFFYIIVIVPISFYTPLCKLQRQRNNNIHITTWNLKDLLFIESNIYYTYRYIAVQSAMPVFKDEIYNDEQYHYIYVKQSNIVKYKMDNDR